MKVKEEARIKKSKYVSSPFEVFLLVPKITERPTSIYVVVYLLIVFLPMERSNRFFFVYGQITDLWYKIKKTTSAPKMFGTSRVWYISTFVLRMFRSNERDQNRWSESCSGEAGAQLSHHTLVSEFSPTFFFTICLSRLDSGTKWAAIVNWLPK